MSNCKGRVAKDGKDTMHFYVLPVAKGPIGSPEFGDKSVVAAFWWVSTTTDKKLANMEMTKMIQDGVTVPVLKNSVDLPPWTKLCIWVKAKVPVNPLQNTIHEKEDDSETSVPQASPKAASAAAPSKKQRRS